MGGRGAALQVAPLAWVAGIATVYGVRVRELVFSPLWLRHASVLCRLRQGGATSESALPDSVAGWRHGLQGVGHNLCTDGCAAPAACRGRRPRLGALTFGVAAAGRRIAHSLRVEHRLDGAFNCYWARRLRGRCRGAALVGRSGGAARPSRVAPAADSDARRPISCACASSGDGWSQFSSGPRLPSCRACGGKPPLSCPAT